MGLDQNLLKRVYLFQILVIVAGLIGFGIAKKGLGALSFGTGAILSSASLWLIHRFVAALGGQKSNPLTYLLMMVRLLLVAVVLYGILRTYEVLLPAVACGVLAPIAAIILAVIYEHFYARTL